ncbi:NAD(P)H-dependent oxidoreductase [Salibaculum sp.]|uniref:NAD(P)H-dependent oxidoreductase n=1 Tax=Salibaculum sp. TaxID=2855480 RepID=UPI002B4A11CB|nr:NAD(P)H-dependent oxidoreductase [Salibaculum sp.]HKL70146.1 NAD(P)H-dependent oxidoreductase [Salibaculum sp.]
MTTPRSLIVTAHPEPESFTHQWAAASARACAAPIESHLVQEGFDPVERAAHFGHEGRFDVLKAQENAADTDTLPGDVAREVGRITAADRLILHFPVWWFGPPAILKGWMDRCLVNGIFHRGSQRFDAGLARGKSVLICATTGGDGVETARDGREGDINLILWPLMHALRYCGFEVLEPAFLHGVHGYQTGDARADMEARMAATLDQQAARLASWDSRPRVPFNADTDFDTEGRLKRGAPAHGPFISHRQ